MSDVTKRILKILESSLSEALNSSLEVRKNMESMVYKDEPIIRRASDLLKKQDPKPAPRPAPVRRPLPEVSDVPEKILALRKLCDSPEAFYMPREELFYRQALFMES